MLISELISLWTKNLFCNTSLFLNPVRLVLWLSIWCTWLTFSSRLAHCLSIMCIHLDLCPFLFLSTYTFFFFFLFLPGPSGSSLWELTINQVFGKIQGLLSVLSLLLGTLLIFSCFSGLGVWTLTPQAFCCPSWARLYTHLRKSLTWHIFAPCCCDLLPGSPCAFVVELSASDLDRLYVLNLDLNPKVLMLPRFPTWFPANLLPF